MFRTISQWYGSSKNSMEIEPNKPQREDIYRPYWESIPQDIKPGIASFLTRREVTMLSRVSKVENENKIIFLLASLSRNPDQIESSNDLTAMIAQLLKLKYKDISSSEQFESLLIKLIQRLDLNPASLFLTKDMDITGQASYQYNQTYNRLIFIYNKLDKDTIIAMAKVLEQYFPGIDTGVVQLDKNGSYHLSIDKKVFIQKILPWLIKTEGKPHKQSHLPREPEIIDYKPQDTGKSYRPSEYTSRM